MKTLADAKALLAGIIWRSNSVDPIADFYRGKRARAQAISKLIENGPWEPAALSHLQRALDVAEYVGD